MTYPDHWFTAAHKVRKTVKFAHLTTLRFFSLEY